MTDPAAYHAWYATRRGAWIARHELQALPFADGGVEHVVAVTSLCFVASPAQAVREMWRVCRCTLTLGLLHRRSLLYRWKGARGSYVGARWDLHEEVLAWTRGLAPTPEITARWAVLLPSGGALARALERLLPGRLRLGSFLAVCLRKPAA
jgi:SAM-dependent methyltransferase